MSESKATLRFDHREIAVIFSLFIFIALLMFTVGILVGKGLAQAKYESVLLHIPPGSAGGATTESTASPNLPPPSGTSVSTDAPKTIETKELKTVEAKPEGKADAKGEEVATEKNVERPTNPATATAEVAKSEAAVPATKQKEESTALELVPKNARPANLAGRSLTEPVKSPEADELMKNPKLRALVDNDAAPGSKPATKRAAGSPKETANTNRASASEKAGSEKISTKEMVEASLASGPFTVQVGSYPTDKDAAERVEALKKLGFSHAYFSAKQWSDTKETWFRVWLGYYSDYESAKRSGRGLQERGEVTNYLVRKTDAAK